MNAIVSSGVMCEFEYYEFSLNEIELRNFRKFDFLKMTLDKQITALTAPNGGGKSAILHAMAVGCAHFVYGLGVRPGINNGFLVDDHRLVQQIGEGSGMTPALGDMQIVCRGRLGHANAQWSRERTYGLNNRTRIANAAVLYHFANEMKAASINADNRGGSVYPVAPIVAMYGTRRLADEARLTEKRKPTRADRFEGYADCLNSSSYLKVFKDWYKAHSAQLLQEEKGSQRYKQIDHQLQIVRNAVDAALSCVSWRNLRWDFVRNDLTMQHEQLGTLCFNQLSDGIQNVLNLIADISHRAVRLNPCAPKDLLLNIRGLVLIDEIDMYLHPQWQQKIISILKTIFPKVQFVITTHSPQVLSTLRKNQIRILGEDEDGHYAAVEPEESPYSHPANVALTHVFNVNPTPDVDEKDEISLVQQLYRSGHCAKAEALREKLLKESGVEFSETDVQFWKLLSTRKS